MPFMTIFTIKLVSLSETFEINGIPGISLMPEFESTEAQSVHPLHYSQSQRAGKSLASSVLNKTLVLMADVANREGKSQ